MDCRVDSSESCGELMLLKILISALFLIYGTALVIAQDLPLRIVEQPEPELPQGYGNLDVQGLILLKVQFRADGSIGQVSPITGLTKGLTDLAVAAAKKIRFEPQIRQGKATDSLSTIAYSYSLDGFKPLSNDFVQPEVSTLSKTQAESIVEKAVQNLGGEKYLGVRSQVARGKFSLFRDGVLISFQNFVDIVVFPDKERTEFKGGGSRSIQVNVGAAGWVYDGEQDKVKDQTQTQVQNFKQGIRTSLDNLLRGGWRGEAELSYVGKRAATLGKRNDVVKLIYKDNFTVEFEFAAEDALPMKAVYKRSNADGEEVKEEDRYAQFVEVSGVRTPFIIDRFTNGLPSSRINYESVEFNRPVPDSVFAKPSNAKDAKKALKL